MDKSVLKDMTSSFDSYSPSELDRKFFGEQSLPSGLSLGQTSRSSVSSDCLVDGSDVKASEQTQASSPNDLSSQGSEKCPLPFQGKSSTPYIFMQKQKNVSFDQSYSDLTASRMFLDVSMINSTSNSPKLCTESSTLELWSPKLLPETHSRSEVSP
ncbi:uncharacterized protein si:ch73-303b9.1 [Syngnathus typhle]|uniref:uncharacterized protein si:ch73-303b9.1 n=1 Tax=Syngnathus typhle TaxID=161592 RepID=UPI002A6A1D60|nr:uncharacterized protein si:ch73-303b9.1 [Syngnathus typhle]